MKREMIVRVSYVCDGKEHHRIFVKYGDMLSLEKGFNDVKDMYLSLQKTNDMRNLKITSEMVLETRPMKFNFASKY